jgi:hypothetical protein
VQQWRDELDGSKGSMPIPYFSLSFDAGQISRVGIET